jgi:hypothetical protein
VAGPVIAATTISLSGAVLSALMRATYSATGVSRPPHSAGAQPVSVTVSVICPVGARRGGATPLQT